MMGAGLKLTFQLLTQSKQIFICTNKCILGVPFLCLTTSFSWIGRVWSEELRRWTKRYKGQTEELVESGTDESWGSPLYDWIPFLKNYRNILWYDTLIKYECLQHIHKIFSLMIFFKDSNMFKWFLFIDIRHLVHQCSTWLQTPIHKTYMLIYIYFI
jgi:hypothetical protein